MSTKPTTDPRIDAYIERSASFARPVLTHLRALVHEQCPAVEETIKWNMPHFLYRGQILCSMASFKAHCAFTFWLGSQLEDPKGVLEKTGRTAMGHFGRIASVEDLPPAPVIGALIREAMALAESGVKKPTR